MKNKTVQTQGKILNKRKPEKQIWEWNTSEGLGYVALLIQVVPVYGLVFNQNLNFHIGHQ
jgi:hypothetical protein